MDEGLKQISNIHDRGGDGAERLLALIELLLSGSLLLHLSLPVELREELMAARSE